MTGKQLGLGDRLARDEGSRGIGICWRQKPEEQTLLSRRRVQSKKRRAEAGARPVFMVVVGERETEGSSLGR